MMCNREIQIFIFPHYLVLLQPIAYFAFTNCGMSLFFMYFYDLVSEYRANNATECIHPVVE